MSDILTRFEVTLPTPVSDSMRAGSEVAGTRMLAL